MDFVSTGKFSSSSKITLPDGHTSSLAGKLGSSIVFIADSDTALNGGAGNDALIYDLTLKGVNALHFSGFDGFDLGAGDDVLDLSVRPANSGHAYVQNVVALGAAGDDVVVGGAGINTLLGDVGAIDSDSAGDDLLFGGGQFDTISGDAFEMSDGGVGGNDYIRGGEGDDVLYGDAGSMSFSSGGTDVIYGDGGNDQIFGDSSGADASSLGSDYLYGGDGDDTIVGDAASMSGRCSAGDDEIDGGAGNDILSGDASSPDGVFSPGADLFVFGLGSGSDTITDFNSGLDKIYLRGFDLDSLPASAFSDNGTASVTVRFGDGGQVVVHAYDNSALTLTNSDFIFA